jgi:hypothetical protein
MEPDQSPEEIHVHAPSVDESRRHFTKSGLAASGVILTLASRPVLGTGINDGKCCMTPSGFMSGNQSTHGTSPVCQGKSPQYWCGNQTSWPVSSEGRFKKHFSCAPSFQYSEFSLLQVCALQSVESGNLCSYLVAAYLNALAGWTPFLTGERIQDMFTECTSKGVFSPTAGVNWTPQQCVEYLKATQQS